MCVCACIYAYVIRPLNDPKDLQRARAFREPGHDRAKICFSYGAVIIDSDDGAQNHVMNRLLKCRSQHPKFKLETLALDIRCIRI